MHCSFFTQNRVERRVNDLTEPTVTKTKAAVFRTTATSAGTVLPWHFALMPISISLIADASAKPALAFADLPRTCFQINSAERNPSQETQYGTKKYFQKSLTPSSSRRAIHWRCRSASGTSLRTTNIYPNKSTSDRHPTRKNPTSLSSRTQLSNIRVRLFRNNRRSHPVLPAK